MKRAPEQSAASSSAPAAKRPRTDPSDPDAPGAKIFQALEAVRPDAGASVDPDALARSFDLQQAARRDWEKLGRELRALEDLEVEVTVLNINAAMLLEKKTFSLPAVESVTGGEGGGDSPTIGSILEAIWARVDQLVQQCKYEEGRAAANAEGGGLPVLDEGKKEGFQGEWWAFLKRAREYAGSTLPDWIAREWTGVAGTDGEQSSVSLELLPATKGVYRLAACDINGGGKIIAILVADRSEVEKNAELDVPGGDLLLPTSFFLSRAVFNVVFAVRMDGHWYKVYAGNLAPASRSPHGLFTSHSFFEGNLVYTWLSTFPGQEQYDCQRKKDMAATHERFPGVELSEVREKILNERDRHRLTWKLSPGNNKPEAHVLSSNTDGFEYRAKRIDDLLKLLQSVEKATPTTSDPTGSTTGATGGAFSGLFLRSEKKAKAREDARAAFLQRLEKNTHPEAGLAPLVKSRLKDEALGNIMLVPDGGDPASAEPCCPGDRLLDLLTQKNADGSARWGWKWLGPGRVEMQFYAMIQ